MPGAALELSRSRMTLEPSPSGRESTRSSFSALQVASPAAWPSRATYSLAAYHPAASQPRSRRRSILCTGKVAGIGASGRPSGERSRLESREGGKSGLPPARAWFEGHVRATKLRSSTWHHSRGSTSQARQAGRHRHGTRFGFLLQKTRRPGIPAMQKCWGFCKPNQKTTLHVTRRKALILRPRCKLLKCLMGL